MDIILLLLLFDHRLLVSKHHTILQHRDMKCHNISISSLGYDVNPNVHIITDRQRERCDGYVHNHVMAIGYRLGIPNLDDYFQTRVSGLDALKHGFWVRILQL